jgi:tetratricopeptide (TPR) repeat protein
VGRGHNFTWRIDAPSCSRRTPDNAFLDPMVAEIACRMFTDMTLRGSVRWQAIQAFTAYLKLYWESLRTPKNRASFLKQAEGQLLTAVAEDETFDLAFYNLGVVYSQLAQAEFQAAASAEYPGRKTEDPEAAHDARTQAAQTAFKKAISLNRGRWEAVYALAVHEFSSAQRRRCLTPAAESETPEADLLCIVQRCERVLQLDGRNAQAYDLMGMAQLQLHEPGVAIRSHRRAVNRSWSRLCRAEYRERRNPPTSGSVLPGAQANAAAALRNLARARYAAAVRHRRIRSRLGIARADRVFHQALSLAPAAVKAAMEHERAGIRESGNHREAVASYQAAVRIEPENPLYWAHLARAQASQGALRTRALHSCRMALDTLSPMYRRTLEPFCLPSLVVTRDEALDVLAGAYGRLDIPQQRQRIGGLRDLAQRIMLAERDQRNPGALEDLLGQCEDDDWWTREQVGLALARKLGARGDWEAAAARYRWLINELEARRPDAIRQHALHSKLAKALRRLGKKHEALASAARGLLLDPISPVARRELGKAHFALLQYEEALDAWQHTLWLTPNDATLHWKAAFSLWSAAQDRQDSRHRYETLAEAAEGFHRAAMLFGIESTSGWAWSRLWLGRVCHEMEEPDRAVKHLRAAKGCAVTQLAARVLVAEVYRDNGQRGLAWDQLTKARKQLRDLVAQAWREDDSTTRALDRRCDRDWGDTLSYREIAARIHLGWSARETGAFAEPAEGARARAPEPRRARPRGPPARAGADQQRGAPRSGAPPAAPADRDSRRKRPRRRPRHGSRPASRRHDRRPARHPPDRGRRSGPRGDGQAARRPLGTGGRPVAQRSRVTRWDATVEIADESAGWTIELTPTPARLRFGRACAASSL